MKHAIGISVRRVMVAILALVGSLVVVSLNASPAAASHYRANQLTWDAGGAANQVEFHLAGSWRCTFYAIPCTIAPGDPVNTQFIDTGDGGVVVREHGGRERRRRQRRRHRRGHAELHLRSARLLCRLIVGLLPTLSSFDGHMNNGDG